MTANLFMAAECEMGKIVRPCSSFKWRKKGSARAPFPHLNELEIKVQTPPVFLFTCTFPPARGDLTAYRH